MCVCSPVDADCVDPDPKYSAPEAPTEAVPEEKERVPEMPVGGWMDEWVG